MSRLNYFLGCRICALVCIAAWVLGLGAVRPLCGVEPTTVTDSASARDALKFELDIQPILPARGCNEGACPGKARGQNGFALSLLGFDANMDYDAIVKNSRGRRVSTAAPRESLLLMKATGRPAAFFI